MVGKSNNLTVCKIKIKFFVNPTRIISKFIYEYKRVSKKVGDSDNI